MTFQLLDNSKDHVHVSSALLTLRKLIVLRKVYVCMYICLSVRTHVSKALEAESSLYTRNKGYTEPL